MSFYEQNLALLARASSGLADRMQQYRAKHGEPLEFRGYRVEPARSGALTAVHTDAATGRTVHLHSAYDPEAEARQFADDLLAGGKGESMYIFLGLGLGYQAREVLSRLEPADRVLIFEPHWELFYLAFCHSDLSPVFSRPNLTICAEPELKGAMYNYMNIFEMAGFSGLRWVANPAFEQLPLAASFREFAANVRLEMMTVGGNMQTLMVMGEMQQMNIILNFPHILDNPPFEHLINRFAGKPAVIVSAGPSLQKNMHLLKELDDKALIIAVDTSTKPLMAAGIKPHVVVTGDPQEANYRHLKGVDLPETYLIAEPQSPVNSLRDWTGPKFICSFHDNLMRWVDRVIGSRGRVLVWGSVAVMAYDIAVKIGANPIVFIGQDLSFPGGRTYTPGTVFEEEDKQDMSVADLARKGHQLIEMTDIYGEKVQTNRQMFAYLGFMKNRFEDREASGRTIINATEGGVLISPRVAILTLRETIDRYMQERFDVWGSLEQAYDSGNPVNYDNLIIELDILLSALRLSHGYTTRGLELVAHTLTALEADDESVAAKTKLVETYNRMIAQRKFIDHHFDAGKMIELANQSGIFSFAKGVKQTKIGDEGMNPEFLKKSCYHYHTLYSSSRDAIERLIPLFEAARNAALERRERHGAQAPAPLPAAAAV